MPLKPFPPTEPPFLTGYRAGYRDGQAGGCSRLLLPLEALELPEPVLCCLRQAQFRQLWEVAALSDARILWLPGLSREGAAQVAQALHRLGIRPTAWDSFLPR